MAEPSAVVTIRAALVRAGADPRRAAPIARRLLLVHQLNGHAVVPDPRCPYYRP